MVLDDIECFLEINKRIIAAFDSHGDGLEDCINELRAATLNHLLQGTAITRTYSSN
jgi:hypothetical protein